METNPQPRINLPKSKIILVAAAVIGLVFFGFFFWQQKSATMAKTDCSKVEKVDNATVIRIENSKFDPAEMTVKVCDTVLFLNLDETKHWPKAPGLFDAGKDLAKFDYYSYQIEKLGSFEITDQSHLEIKGKITVVKKISDLRTFEPIKLPTETVYLTFDADMTTGMQARLTSGQVKKWYDDRVFAYLEDNQIPAVIFSTGLFAKSYPDLIKKLSSYNFIEIGNHSYDHPGFVRPCYNLRTISTDRDKIYQIAETQKILKDLTDKTPKLFRFPGLCHTDHDDSLVASLGLDLIDQNPLVSGDAFNKNANAVVNKIISSVHDGSVIVMHIGGPNSPTDYEVLKAIVPKLKQMGYSLGLK